MPEAASFVTGHGTTGAYSLSQCSAEPQSRVPCSVASSTKEQGTDRSEINSQLPPGLRTRAPCSGEPETCIQCSERAACRAPSLCHVCDECCVQLSDAPGNESTSRGVKTCSCCCRCCCCCCFSSPRAPHSWETETGQVPRGLISRLTKSCQRGKIVWRRVLYVFYRLRQVRDKVCAKMGHLQELRHRLQRVRKVLYVCEGMNNSMGEAMAAARDRNTRYQSVQQDTTLGFPYQVQRPDGEERYPSKKPHPVLDQEEIIREYIKPPANKTLSDVNVNGPHRSCSVGGFPTQPECGLGHSGIHHHHHRYSAPLDAQSPHPAVSASASSSSSSSSSSSLQTWGGRDEGPSSRSSRTPLVRNCFAPFTSGRFERPLQSFHQESHRRRSRHQGHLGTNSPSPSHDQNLSIPYCPTTNTLAEITMVSVPCGPSTHSPNPNHPGGPSDSQGINMGGLGVQGDLSHTYGQSSELQCSPTAEPEHPPLYSDVIENTNLYPSASRPSEQRTKSGKI